MKRVLHATIVETANNLGTAWEIFDQSRKAAMIGVGFAGPKLLLHQTNAKSSDVVEVTVGQAYDLIHVLTRALSIPVKGFGETPIVPTKGFE